MTSLLAITASCDSITTHCRCAHVKLRNVHAYQLDPRWPRVHRQPIAKAQLYARWTHVGVTLAVLHSARQAKSCLQCSIVPCSSNQVCNSLELRLPDRSASGSSPCERCVMDAAVTAALLKSFCIPVAMSQHCRDIADLTINACTNPSCYVIHYVIVYFEVLSCAGQTASRELQLG